LSYLPVLGLRKEKPEGGMEPRSLTLPKIPKVNQTKANVSVGQKVELDRRIR